MVEQLKKNIVAILIFAGLAIIPAVSGTTDIQDVVIRIIIYAIVGEAWNLISGFTGQTSFGHAAYFAVGAYTVSVLGNYYDITPWIGMFVGAAISVLLAVAVNFRLFKLQGHYFAIATLAVCEIMRQICSVWTYVGGGDGMNVKVRSQNKLFWLALDVRNRMPFLYAALAVLIIVFIICLMLERSKFGFYWKAIRESHEVAESIGINPQTYKMYAMMFSAAIAAIGGAFYVQAYKYVDSTIILTLDMSMIFVLVTVLGGLGNVYGPLIGSIIYYVLELFFRRVTGGAASGINLVVFGLLIVLITCFQPKGIVGIAQSVKERLQKPKKTDEGGGFVGADK